MNSWFVFLLIFGIIVILILIFGLPRKRNERKISIEGLDSSVANAFEKMTNLLPFKLLRKRIINELKNYKMKGLLIDIGCGSGNLIVEMAQNFEELELLGIDISSEILDLAKKRANSNEVNEKINFKIGNAEKLPLLDNTADFIVSSLSLHHWSDPKKAFRELVRVLKKDGILLIFDFRRDSRRFFYGLLTFATKIVVPKALKEINEPLGSLKASYTKEEIRDILLEIDMLDIKILSYLAWMFIIIKKS
ncbi:MAG: class I SAM-dependent methyltransferase [Promethearchaeota archaeon]